MCWMTITCPKCSAESSLDDMTRRPISGFLPPGQFQCPLCSYAFQRRMVSPGHSFMYQGEPDYMRGEIGLVPCQATL